MQFGIMTKERILELSSGRITMVDEVTQDSTRESMRFNDAGIYSETIFGPSGHTELNVRKHDLIHETSPRYNLWGHIETKLPFVMPGVKLKALIGSGSYSFAKLDLTSGFESIDCMLITKPNFNKLEFDSRYEKIKFNYIKPIIKPLRARQDCLWNTRVFSDGRGYRMFNLHSALNLGLDNMFFIIPGPYALGIILSHIDVEYEMNEIAKFYKELESNPSFAMEMLTGSARKGLKAALPVIADKFESLRGLALQGIKPEDYVLDTVAVMPPGFRDPIATNTKGGRTIQIRYINNMYNGILKQINNKNVTMQPFDEIMEVIKGDLKDYVLFEGTEFTKSTNIEIMYNIRRLLDQYIIKNRENEGDAISKTLGSKPGRFRREKMSKRVDSSMRGVIIPDVNIGFDEIGIPTKLLYHMITDLKALEREKPFIEFSSKKTIEPFNLDLYNKLKKVENIISNWRVIAIRYPSLHRFNEMGAIPVLTSGDAIKINPIRCSPYNADFDGDQMSLIIVRMIKSILEIDEYALPSKNMLDATGNALMTPSQDMILGLYYATMDSPNTAQELIAEYETIQAMVKDFQLGNIDIWDKVTVKLDRYDIRYKNYKSIRLADKAKIKDFEEIQNEVEVTLEEPPVVYNVDSFTVKSRGTTKRRLKTNPRIVDIQSDVKSPVTSTVGRFLINEFLPQNLGHVDRTVDEYGLEIDKPMHKGVINKLLTKAIKAMSQEESILLSEDLMKNGFKYSTYAGLSLSCIDIYQSPVKVRLMKENEREISLLKNKSDQEKIAFWSKLNKQIQDNTTKELEHTNPLKIMVDSKARGSANQVMQLTGAKGLIARADGTIIPEPIYDSLIEGFQPLSYFVSSYGGRKGMVDRSLTTARTGDIERHLVYGNASSIITRGDCGDHEGVLVRDRLFSPRQNIAIPLSIPNADENGNIDYRPVPAIYLSAGDTMTVYDGKQNYMAEVMLVEDVIAKIRKNEFNIVSINGEEYKPENKESLVSVYRKIKSYFNIMDNEGVEKVIIPLKIGGKLVDRNEFLLDRFLARDTEVDGKVYKRNHKITEEDIKVLDSLDEIYIRSPLSCKSGVGLCARCFGENLIEQRFSACGDAVGIIAAETLGERTTQLTLRTFHTGGVASDDDITQGLSSFENYIQSDKKFQKYNLFTELSDDMETVLAMKSSLSDEVQLTRQFVMRQASKLQEKGMTDFNEILSNVLVGDLVAEDGTPLGFEHFGLLDTHTRQISGEESNAFIEGVYRASDIELPKVYYETVVANSLQYGRIMLAGDTSYSIGEVVRIGEIIETNIKMILEGKDICYFITNIQSMKSIAMKEPATGLSFQRLNDLTFGYAAKAKEDLLISPLATIVASKKTPVGKFGFTSIKDKVSIAHPALSFEELNKEYLQEYDRKLIFSQEDIVLTAEPIDYSSRFMNSENEEPLKFGGQEDAEVHVKSIDQEIDLGEDIDEDEIIEFEGLDEEQDSDLGSLEF